MLIWTVAAPDQEHKRQSRLVGRIHRIESGNA